ncbi:IS5 family transposase [Streptosporangium sp. NPDC049644]|uniref:IS5 family transposase n=1 Tax=Streptosporangium sp. NPDC049644 TaxID=3155507 RepID=UPI00341A7B5A
MILDGEVVKALEEAAEQEKGLRQRGKTPRTANPAKTGTGTNPGGYDCGAEYGRRWPGWAALGGLTSKVHLSADRRCRPLSFVLTPGQAGDSPQFRTVLARIKIRLPAGRPRTRPAAVAADKAYSSHGNRLYLRRRRIKALIPEKTDQAANRKNRGSRGGRPVSHDAELYKQRNTAEQCINRIKEWRALAFRPDKTPESYLAGLHLRGAILWIRSLQPT